MKANLRNLPLQYDSMVIEPLDDDAEASVGDLTDDLLDIYSDLKRGLLHWDAGRKVEAEWEWQFGFHHHWGAHAVQAMGCLHECLSHGS